jgi:tetratricopeptide (TPR) repeat protein
MKKHIIIWSITSVLLTAAVVLAIVQGDPYSRPGNPLEARDTLARCMALLQEDPSVREPQTQAAVRAAAVLSEQGQRQTAEAAYVLGLQYLRERNPAGAEALYKRAIILRPDWSLPYTQLGNVLGRYNKGRVDEAVAMLRKAMELDPEHALPHIILAIVFRIEDRLEEAEEEALIAVKLDPEDLASYNIYANVLLKLERWDEAETVFKQAIALEPDHATPYYNLACLYSRTHRSDQALSHLEKAFELERSGRLRLEAATEEDLVTIRELPEFRALVFSKVKK